MTIGIKPDPNFFRVKYKDVAPKVGLVPYRLGNDIPTFQMHRARLQDDLFWDILQELRGATAQYGTPDFHPNEEATSRYISAVYIQLLAPSPPFFIIILFYYQKSNICIVFQQNYIPILRYSVEHARCSSRDSDHITKTNNQVPVHSRRGHHCLIYSGPIQDGTCSRAA